MRRAPDAIVDCIQPVVTGLGYEFVGAQYAHRSNGGLLRVFIDHADGVGIEDCVRVSEHLSAVLDVEDPIKEAFVLEVSSPGLDRPLFTAENFMAVLEQQVRVKLMVDYDGRRNFTGRLVSADERAIRLEANAKQAWDIALADIEEARLVPQFAKGQKRKN